jgi:hypothetical protein
MSGALLFSWNAIETPLLDEKNAHVMWLVEWGAGVEGGGEVGADIA